MQIDLTDDDVDDILEALRLYEDELMFSGDGSTFTEEVLLNIESLRERIYEERRRVSH